MNTTTSKSFRAGKEFERDFARQYRAAGYNLIRLVDANHNRNPCDYFSVVPGMACFFELKSTACAEFPLIDIRPHQLEAMAEYDRAAPGIIHAGFIIQFRSSSMNIIYYLSGSAMQVYADRGDSYLDTDYLFEHGILIPTDKPTPRAQKYSIMDIPVFVTHLRKS